jgi:hypothetical protein
VPEAVQIITWSGRRDLNPGSLVPQTSALTKLGHVPLPLTDGQIIAQDPSRLDGSGPPRMRVVAWRAAELLPWIHGLRVMLLFRACN